MATLSFSRRLFTSNFNDDFTKSKRVGPNIEPETSIRKTRLDSGRFAVGISLAFSPIRTKRCFSFQGQTPTSVVILTGSTPVGLA